LSVDVASLVFEIDSTQAKRAAADLDLVTAAGDRLDVSARKVQTATQLAGIGMQQSNGATVSATRSATDLANAQGAVEKATRGAAAASAETRATRALEAAAMREMVLASKAYEASLAAQAREEAAAAASKARLATQVDNILGRMDPLVKIQNVAAASTAKLDHALAAGVITAEKHAVATAQVVAAAERGAVGFTHLAGGAKLTNLQMQEFTGIARHSFDALAAGANPFTVITTHIASLGQALGSGPGGVGGSLAALLTPLNLAIAGFVAAGAAVAVLAFGAFKGASEIDKFEGSLIATGNAAGLTTSSLYAMAGAVAASSDTTILASRKTIEALAATGKFNKDTINSLADSAEQYARITGDSADKFVKEYDGMKDHLVAFAVKHEDIYHDLTLAEVQRIANLVKLGQETAAQELLAQDIDRVAKERAKEKMIQEETNYGLLQQWGRNLKENWTNAWDAILGIGRPMSNLDKVGQAVSKLSADSMQVQIARQTPLGNTAAARKVQDTALASDYAAVNAAQAALKAENDKADAQAAETKKNHDAIQKAFGDGKAHGRTPTDNNATALDTAQKAQLAAQLSLTADIEQVAAIKRDEVAAELKLQEDRIAKQAKEHSITAATATLADAAYKAAADAKDELINRQEAAALIERELAQRRALGSDLDAIASIQASMAGTAAQANAIEAKALIDRQTLEHDALIAQTNQDVIAKKITDVQQVQLLVSNDNVHAAQREQQARQAQIKAIEEAAALQISALDRQRGILEADASLLKSTYAQSVVGEQILALDQQAALAKAQEAVDVATIGSAARQQAENALVALRAEQDAAKRLAAERTDLLHGIAEANDAVDSFKQALARHDWAGVFDQLQRTIQTIEASFAKNGLGGGMMTGGSAIASLIGGPAGNAIGTGLGIAGLGASLGAAVGSFAAGSAGAAFAGAAAGANAIGMSALGSLASTLAPLLGPIGIIAGIGVALASLLKSKPSNNAAIATLNGDNGFAISGDKQTTETAQAATSAATAVQQGEQLLEAAGIKLATTVSKIDLGTRDLTHVFLSTGEEIRSAVGDPAAAAEAGLKAVLQGATYTSDAEKQLVDSMVAAGQGFDAIATAINNYQAAQTIAAALGDQILQLTDPKAYDLKGVHDAIEAQKAAAQAAATAGYLTADQLTGINGQLATLEGLQVDQVMKRYADATDTATSAVQAAQDGVDASRQALTDAYDAQANALQSSIDNLRQFATSLATYRASLDTGASALNDPSRQLAVTRAQFERLSALPADDATRLAGLQTAGEAFLAASKAAAPTQAAYNRDLAEVRKATSASATAAGQAADVGQQQLDALNASVSGLIDVNASVQAGTLSVTDAINNLNAALQALATAQAAATAAATPPPSTAVPTTTATAVNDNTSATNGNAPPTSAVPTVDQIQAAVQASLGGGFNRGEFGPQQQFATGGSFTVQGPTAGDHVPVDFRANGGETVNISKSDSMAELASETRALRQEVAALRKAAESTARATGSMDTRGAKQDIRGVYVRGETPEDPVSTKEVAA
jgi:hypothetical protein